MSSGTAAAPAPATMKLFVDRGSQRVVFAEAGKDVVDFLFGLLAMPLGAADRLLAAAGDDGGGALGSIANVYASVEKMDAACVQSAAARDTLLLDPATPPPPPRPSSPSAAADSSDTYRFIYDGSRISFSEPTALSSPLAPAVPPHVLTFDPTTAPFCSPARQPSWDTRFPFGVPPPVPKPPAPAVTGVKLLCPDPNCALPLFLYRCDACRAARLPKGSGGFVKDLAAASYTVTDDLTVAPASGASRIVALVKSLGVKDLESSTRSRRGRSTSDAKRCRRSTALGILKAALHSKTVLTDAFLDKRTKRARVSGDKPTRTTRIYI
ncbi:unnamed protein product [Urochloa decumbens]|uniref:Uncharacterized protein n=1 Tax=Urochloa decumbens TaxID=240449 RepID=A0ABC8ZPK8_9POAL